MTIYTITGKRRYKAMVWRLGQGWSEENLMDTYNYRRQYKSIEAATQALEQLQPHKRGWQLEVVQIQEDK